MNKAHPDLPPASILDYLDPMPNGASQRLLRLAPYGDAFVRRLDVASARVSSVSRTVPPLGIIVAFERAGIGLKYNFELQGQITDAEIEARAHEAYDASLPKPRKSGSMK